MADNIKVVVRVRPLVQREINENRTIRWITNGPTIQSVDGGNAYVFDHVFNNQSTFEIYSEIVAPIVMATMEGFNGTVFAYGQTASGKTFTMFGDDNMPGIVPVAVDDIFNTIENNPEREYVTSVQYMEIYNEAVSDLLTDSKSLDIREDMDGNVYVRGLKDEFVTTSAQVMEVIKKGEKKRHFAATNMNERSSRSHTLFRITIGSRKRCDDPAKSEEQPVTVAHLNLVDLAGSEKANQTGATGMRLVEGGNINRSLLTLSQVISQLSENAGFVSYRDSKLTRILQNALGGNSKTAIISNVTPAFFDETNSTLKFATRAKRVKNKPVLNEVLSEAAMLQKYKTEVEKLQKQLNTVTNMDMDQENKELKEQLKEMERQSKEQEDKLHELSKFFFSSSKAEAVTKVKAKRRQTWYAGKTRMSVAPLSMRRTLDSPGKASFREMDEDNFVKPQIPFTDRQPRNPRTGQQLSFNLDMDETMDNLSMPNQSFGTSQSLKCEMQAAQQDNVSTASNEESSPGSAGEGRSMEALHLQIEQKNDKIRQLFEIIELQSADMDAMEQKVIQLSQSLTPAEKPADQTECGGCKSLRELEEKLSQVLLQDSERAKREEELREEMSTLTKMNQELQGVLATKEDEIMELKDLRMFEKEEGDLRNESMFHHQLENEIEKGLENQQDEMMRLKEQLLESQRELEETRRQLADVKTCDVDHDDESQKNSDAEMQALRDQIAELQKELEDSKLQRLDMDNDDVFSSELDKERELHDLEVADLQGQIAQMRLELEESKLTNEQNVVDKLDSDVEIENETNKLEVRSLQDQVTELQARLEEAMRQVEDAKMGNQEILLEKEEKHQNEMSELKTQLEQMQQELEKTKNELDEVTKELDSASKIDDQVDVDALIAKAVNEEKRRGQVEMQDKLTSAKREALTTVADEQNALLADLKKEENEKKQLMQKYAKAKNDADLAEHQMRKAEEEKEAIRSEMHTMHSLLMNHEKQAKSMENNPEKLMDRFKKMATNLDLTTQRCQKYEAQMKEFKGIADKADDLTFQRNNLQRQLRECENELKKSQDGLGNLRQVNASYQTQMSQFKLQIDLQQDSIEQMKADKAQAEYCLEEFKKNNKSQANDLKQLETDMENKWLKKVKDERMKVEEEFASQEKELKEEYEKEKERLKKEIENLEKEIQKSQVERRESLKELEGALERKWREKMEDERNAMMRELVAKEDELIDENRSAKEEMMKMKSELDKERRGQSSQVDAEKLKGLEEEIENRWREKMDDERMKMEEKIEDERMKMEEKIESERMEMADKLEDERMKMKDEGIKMEEQMKMEEKLEEERMKLEEKLEEVIMKMEEKLEEERMEMEEKLEDERMKMEEKLEEERMKMEEKLEEERIKMEREFVEKEEELKQENEKELEEMKKMMDEVEKEMKERAAQMANTDSNLQEFEETLEKKYEEKLAVESATCDMRLETREKEIREEFENEKESLKERLAEMEEDLEKRLNEVQLAKDHIEEENMALKECIDMTQNEISELKNTLVRLTEEHETTLLMLHSPRRSSDHTHLKLREADETINRLTASVSDLEKSLKFESRERLRLREVCEELEASQMKNLEELQLLKKELEKRDMEVEPLKAKITELEDFLKIETAERERLRNVCDEFAVDLDKNEAEIEKLKVEIEQKENTIKELQECPSTENEEKVPVKETSNLQVKIIELEEFLQIETSERDRLRHICDEFASELDKNEAEIEKLKKELESRDAQYKELNEKVQSQPGGNTSQGQEEASKLQARITQLEEFLQIETGERERLRNVCDDFAVDLDKFETEVETLRAEVEKKNVEIQHLQESKQKQDNENSQSGAEEVRKLQARIAELEEFLQIETSERERLRDVCDDFAVDLDKNEVEIEKLKKEVESREAENKTLNARVAELEENLDKNVAEIQKLRTEIGQKNSEVLLLKDKLAKPEDDSSRMQEVNKLEAKINELQEFLELETNERQRLRNVSDEFATELDKNEAEIEKLKSEHEKKNSEIETLKEQLRKGNDTKQSDQEVSRLQARIAELEDFLKIETSERERLRDVCDDFAVDLDKNEAEIKTLQKEISEKNKEIQQIKEQPKKAKDDETTSKEMAKLKAKINELEEFLELERTERERLRNVSDEFAAELDKNEAEIDKLKSELESKDSAMKRLKGLNTTGSATSQEFCEKENVELREKIKRGSWLLQEKEKELEQWKKKYFSLKADREQLFDTLQTKKTEIQKLQHVIQDNSMDDADLTAEERQRGLIQCYTHAKMNLDSLQAAYKELVENTEEKKKEYRAIIVQLRKEVKELKEEVLKKPASAANKADRSVADEKLDVPESFNEFLKSLDREDNMGPLDFTSSQGKSGGASSIEIENAEMRVRLKKCYQTIRQKAVEMKKINGRFATVTREREQLYDTLQEKKKEILKLQNIIEDNRMDCTELTDEEREIGLKQSFQQLKTMYDSLKAGYKEQGEQHEEKRKEYRGIIANLRKEIKELKESKGVPNRTTLSEIQNVEQDDEGADGCKQQ